MWPFLKLRIFAKTGHPTGVFNSRNRISSVVGFTESPVTKGEKNIPLMATKPGTSNPQYMLRKTITHESRSLEKNSEAKRPRFGFRDLLTIRHVISRNRKYTRKERRRINKGRKEREALKQRNWQGHWAEQKKRHKP